MRKNILELIALSMASESMVNDHLSNPNKGNNDFKGKTERDIERLKFRYQKLLKEKGVKEFYYGDVCILARDQKNADRKAKNKGLI